VASVVQAIEEGAGSDVRLEGYKVSISSRSQRSVQGSNSSSLQLDHEKTGETSPPVISTMEEVVLCIIRAIGRRDCHKRGG
jgi:hypothetical protein